MQTSTPAEIAISLQGEEIRLGPAAARMTVAGAVLAVAGFGTACALGLGTPESRRLFSHAYLVAFAFFLSITLGALFFVMLHHLCRAGWSVSLRRLAEGLGGNVALMGLLFLPVLVGMGDLYQWSHPDAAAHSEPLAGKAAYLTPTAFLLRFAIYFTVWGGLAWYLRSRSIRQDATGDVRLSLALERVSAPGMIALGLTVTFAAFDLVMSLHPGWSSTIFGLYFLTGCVLGGLVALVLLAVWLQANGRIRCAVTAEHYHDLGKLTFAAVFFWGYVAFSQYMLIWYANLPEETQFYLPRQIGPWAAVSIVLVFCHLVLPFVGLLSRHAKRRVTVLAFWAIWLLAAHLLDLFWLVMPNVFIREIPAAVGAAPGTPLPEALRELVASNHAVYQVAEEHLAFMRTVEMPLEPASVTIVIGLVLGMGGLYLASTARLLRSASLVPLRDPRLAEALAFENT